LTWKKAKMMGQKGHVILFVLERKKKLGKELGTLKGTRPGLLNWKGGAPQRSV